MAVAQPAGTVTLVFTDIEGSTRLLEELGVDAYRDALATHRDVVRAACGRHQGYEVHFEGDAFFFAFQSAEAAVAAVSEAMVGLEEGPIRIRVGVHTGEPGLDPPKYVGIDVHRAARLMSAGHGGQVLLSQAAWDLLDGVAARDLGEHRFKDLGAPERVFQLGERVFQPIRSLYRSNLPVPATPFLGREPELAAVTGMLSEAGVRLVSLVGPGGTGKTRLALQAAAEVSDGFPDGVWWVPLAPLRDPALVLAAVAAAVGVSESVGGTPIGDLAKGLAGRRLLVVVDNLEHLLPAAAEAIGAIVAACPTVTTVVTSRERLQVSGERVYAVPPMSDTDGKELFRSRAADAGVELEASDELRSLCARLDHLPLALELAAARTVVFSPAQLLDRLAQWLDLLRGGRGGDARQQTLRATIAWSHDLLDSEEQHLFRRLSVFAGGCSLESAEQVAGADPDTLQSLLDKSLVRRRDSTGEPRFWMLETIREFAAERLAAAGETDGLERRHLDHYAAVAEACYDETIQRGDDYERLEVERENLRLALDLALTTDPELALELARRLLPSWDQRGDHREGRERLAAALAQTEGTPTLARAWALDAAARLAGLQSDLEAADNLSSDALALFRQLGDRRGAGMALNSLGWNAFYRGDSADAERLFEEAVEAHSDPGEEQVQLTALAGLAACASVQGDHTQAVTLFREIVAKTRREGSTARLAGVLNNLGVAEEAAGETEQARRSLEESVALSRQTGQKQFLTDALHSLGHLKQETAPAEALAHYSGSLRLAREMEEPHGIAYCLEGGAAIYAAGGEPAYAASMLGAAAAIRTQTGLVLEPVEQAEVDTLEAQCRQALPAEAFTRAWEDGAALDANAAADWALRLWEESG